jgi:signal transduction histidine kinase
MRRAALQPGAARERWALAIGLGAAGLLALAALAPFSDPELAAQASFTRSAGQAAAAVGEEWVRMLAAEVEPCAPASPVFEAEVERPERVPIRDLSSERGAPTAFDALLAESERLELVEQDPAGALAAAREALTKNPDAARRAEGRLRVIQLALSVGEPAAAREQWLALATEVAPSDARGTIAYLLLGLLAAAPALGAEERAAAAESVAAAWMDGRLALPVSDLRVERQAGESARFELTGGATLGALEARLQALDPGVALELEVTRAILGMDALARFTAAHGVDEAAPLPEERWRLTPCAGGLLVQRDRLWQHGVTRRAYLAAADAPLAALEARVARERLLPDGFALDIAGGREELGPLVRGATELAAGAGRFWLRHRDPEAAMRGGGARLALLRAGLWLATALCAAAAVATWHALRRDRRLAALRTAFVASVSHELRTPVSSILLLAENLQSGRVGAAGAAGYHALLRREALRLRGLVDDVLDMSRLERGKPLCVHVEPLELAPWLADLAVDARAWAEEHGIELVLALDGVAGQVSADGEALRRAVFNLLDNARKHSGARRVELEAALAGDRLVLSVRDHGRGIPAAQRARAFEPFERLDGEGTGAGLGLAIVREIAHAHAGEARVLAAAPGARFELELPGVPRSEAE